MRRKTRSRHSFATARKFRKNGIFGLGNSPFTDFRIYEIDCNGNRDRVYKSKQAKDEIRFKLRKQSNSCLEKQIQLCFQISRLCFCENSNRFYLCITPIASLLYPEIEVPREFRRGKSTLQIPQNATCRAKHRKQRALNLMRCRNLRIALNNTIMGFLILICETQDCGL